MSRPARVRQTVWMLLLGSGTASAHHSIAPFDQEQVLTISGEVTEVSWVNPHTTLRIDVTNADGSVTSWTIETESARALENRGLSEDMLEPGDQVAVEVHPLKSGEPRGLFLSTITPDGVLIILGGGEVRRRPGRR